MRKVLVDPAALEEAAKWLEIHSSSSGSAEAFAADALRQAIAKPAESEGVSVVGYAVTWIRVGDTPEKTVFMSAADFDATGGPRFYSYREPLVLQSAHIAALSAVTAERDRLLSEAHGQMVEAFAERDEVIAERDQLRAEVERYVPLHEAVQRAAGELPEGWAIQLYIERDGGGVELIGPDGTEDFATNNERLDWTVIDALEAAMAAKEA